MARDLSRQRIADHWPVVTIITAPGATKRWMFRGSCSLKGWTLVSLSDEVGFVVSVISR